MMKIIIFSPRYVYILVRIYTSPVWIKKNITSMDVKKKLPVKLEFFLAFWIFLCISIRFISPGTVPTFFVCLRLYCPFHKIAIHYFHTKKTSNHPTETLTFNKPSHSKNPNQAKRTSKQHKNTWRFAYTKRKQWPRSDNIRLIKHRPKRRLFCSSVKQPRKLYKNSIKKTSRRGQTRRCLTSLANFRNCTRAVFSSRVNSYLLYFAFWEDLPFEKCALCSAGD